MHRYPKDGIITIAKGTVMVRIMKDRWTEHIVEYTHEFQWNDGSTAGFSFPCDHEGVPHPAKNEYMAENREIVALGVAIGIMEDLGVRKYERDYTHAAVIQCERCKRAVILDSYWTNSCTCGADYNGDGNRLAPRSQWGEETGEHPCDVHNLR